MIIIGLNAQSLDDLRNRKEKAAAEIRLTNELLEKAKENEKISLNQLRLINNSINQRNKLISAQNSEIKLLQEFIDDNTMVVRMFQEDLKGIKEEYAEMIRFAYKNRNTSDYLIFLLSSNNFNQAYKRHLYLKQYTGFRKVQAQTIESIQNILDVKAKDLSRQKDEKSRLLAEMEDENRNLKNDKQQQDSYIRKMQQEQRSLQQKIREQQRIERDLENQIQKIIEEEAKKARDAGKPGYALTPEQKLIGDNFGQNKSRLPWPVERGIITEHFGEHNHPTLKNIVLNNNGVDIATEPGAKARSVFTGEVSRVFAISGGNMAVIIRHGSYLSVYSNLSEVTVKAGDKVTIKQNIGSVYTDVNEGNNTILKFQVWFENQKMDPEVWLVK
ncbi:MAG: peptidoglycan DD-metalloendopeptidase family protein [Prolixibacteraceae bacterium]|nr:peptidoglycan DD-metalloendopeptidase family protein [Prolixibacteraceae bacterium]